MGMQNTEFSFTVIVNPHLVGLLVCNKPLEKQNKANKSISGTHRINARDFVANKPSQNLFSECLPNIYYNILMCTFILAIVNQKRSIAPA